jgi:hypothetical protein
MIMLANLELEPIALAARNVHRIEQAAGLEVSCVRGAIWITQARDPRDVVLMPGQSVALDRPGLAVVYAFQDAVITVGPARRLPLPSTSVPVVSGYREPVGARA